MRINVFGMPSFAGAFYSGTELAPAALREAGLIQSLQAKGMDVNDVGNLQLPVYLPRHNVPPVRNWPAPRMVWETIVDAGTQWHCPDTFSLILGGDCSIVVGTASYLQQQYGDQLHIIVVDGHLDTMKPMADRCIGAAGMGLWFLVNDSMMWNGAMMKSEHIQLLGCQSVPDETYGIAIQDLEHMKLKGIAETAKEALAALPADAKVLVHFDVDVIHRLDMPSAYSPSDRGLGMEECMALLAGIVADSRVVALEVTEFSGLRDLDGSSASSLANMLAEVMAAKVDQAKTKV